MCHASHNRPLTDSVHVALHTGKGTLAMRGCVEGTEACKMCKPGNVLVHLVMVHESGVMVISTKNQSAFTQCDAQANAQIVPPCLDKKKA